MRLVRRNNYHRPADFFPSFFNDIFAEDFLANAKLNHKKAVDTKPVSTTQPAVNIKDDEDRFLIEVAAPGFDKENFNIELDKGVLTISATFEQQEEETKENYSYKEFAKKSFKRSFNVPEDKINAEGISAAYKAGLLYVTLPKKAKEETKRQIDIK